MKTYVLTLTAALVLAIVFVGGTQSASAQWLAQYGVASQGTFGPRVIGRPLVVGNQTESIFGPRAIGSPVAGPGNYFAPNALVIPNGYYVYNNPYSGNPSISPLTAYSTQIAGLQPPEVNNALVNSMPPEANLTQGVGPVAQGVPASPGYSAGAVTTALPTGALPAGATPSGTAPGTNPNAAATGTSDAAQTANPAAPPTIPTNVTPQRGKFRTAAASPLVPQPFALSPDLSDRLTSIARNRGMLMSNGINVYLSNDTALIQGVVRTPSDRASLASVLGLEPDVARVDNRLQVGAAAR
jgi:hypothetical protein